jgi:hypothetical protein
MRQQEKSDDWTSNCDLRTVGPVLGRTCDGSRLQAGVAGDRDALDPRHAGHRQERWRVHDDQQQGNDQVMRMRELEKGLEIPAGATVTLKPGGYHIMFMELKAPLAKDAKVPVTLVFEKAGSIDVDFNVEALGAAGTGHQMR